MGQIYQFHGTNGPDMVSFSGSKWLNMCRLSAISDFNLPERRGTGVSNTLGLLDSSIKIHMVHFFFFNSKQLLPCKKTTSYSFISRFLNLP